MTAPLPPLDETHDAGLRGWLASANDAGSDFPVQNLPFGVFRRAGSSEARRGGVAIGDTIVDLAALAARGEAGQGAFAALDGREALALEAARAASGETLNALMALGPAHWHALRLALSRALREGAAAEARRALEGALVPQAQAEMALPARIGDYTDFYTSIHHATNIGRLFRPDQPLLPNYRWVPIGYHGRASSVAVSPQAFRRPRGQTMPPGAAEPQFGPSKRLDIELELGLYIGPGNALGEPVPIAEAERHLFGVCLLNDWSARDIQGWEYQPLGPFLSKNFATTVSPWIVTMEALAPFRRPFARPEGDPQPLAYLDGAANRAAGVLDIRLEARLQTAAMRAGGLPPATICQTNCAHAYWTAAQLVAHHSVNGCNLQPGDLLGTGTLSGPEPHQAAALIELTAGGKRPLALPGGEQRTWLEDGDTVELAGWCEREGAARIGLGRCIGTVLAAG